jgi:hypothetical protein
MPLSRCRLALVLSHHAGLFRHSRVSCGCSCNAIEVGVPMDFLQSMRNDQVNKHDLVALVPEPTLIKARPDALERNPGDQSFATTISPQLVDVTAEETCPAPPVQVTAQDGAPQPASAKLTARAPSTRTFELMSELESLATDLAVKGRASSDHVHESAFERIDASGGLSADEPSIRVASRPIGFENYQFATNRPSTNRRTVIVLASFFMVAMIGLGAALDWHSLGGWTMTKFNGIDFTAKGRDSAPAGPASTSDTPQFQSAPVAQMATTPSVSVISPDLVKQLEAITQDLASVRHSVEELAAQQSYVAASQQQLEQLAVKQDQLAAKQAQMAQNIAKLQALAQTARSRPSTSIPLQANPSPPRIPLEPAAQSPAAPRPPAHPVPPLSVPP